jgi:small redox-active disulfide protein 2
LKVEILGTGCTKCKTLEELVKETIDSLGLDAEVIKVTDINKIIEYGVMLTPALVIDGKVRVAGRLPSRQEVEDQLRDASK